MLTEAMHEYMYDKTNESPGTEEEKLHVVEKIEIQQSANRTISKGKETGLQQMWSTHPIGPNIKSFPREGRKAYKKW